MIITDLIRAKESINVSDIHIFLQEGTPVVFDSSAIYLQLHFPEMEIKSVLCGDRRHHKLIQGFDLEQVLKRMAQYSCLVDDECISFMKVV
ncbi:hypothetical protein [Bacteroides helcogenes]|uniref:Uncharacterized protein n=1 Tax=Bacteroides helcogenes (strain ATCC 35417 / DSM 20613 / JCM 6297 / CCUG 15421 / P 36-108) TaxID=693979 RepID=E6SVB7_BACT6|nr:hypothetical protein [Bacteroides helcogenes]ADV44483.1 hypothetical protein Bache_2520 [Bacteroides helcogenes P 36-108]MDY5237136.1 hypothetical protein [Bacteroides helcogenes]